MATAPPRPDSGWLVISVALGIDRAIQRHTQRPHGRPAAQCGAGMAICLVALVILGDTAVEPRL